MGDPDIRSALGLIKSSGNLQSSVSPDHLARALGRIITEIATAVITVSDIKRKNDRAKYLDRIRDDLPDLATSSVEPYDLSLNTQEKESSNNTQSDKKINKTGQNKLVPTSTSVTADDLSSTAQGTESSNIQPTNKTVQNKSVPTSTNRLVLIPKGCILSIEEPRINNVYKELRKLDVETYPNAVAVLSRVFLEMSINHYMNVFILTGKDELKPRIDIVCEDLKVKKVNQDRLKSVRLAASQCGAPFSVDLLNGYIHNQFVNPDAKTLKTAWDNVQPFFETLWEQVKLSKQSKIPVSSI